MVEVKDWARPDSCSRTDENEPRPTVSGEAERCMASMVGEVGEQTGIMEPWYECLEIIGATGPRNRDGIVRLERGKGREGSIMASDDGGVVFVVL